jgi:NAD(P)-dependent dehydrogenase (short-subunit alcohol dehydrogenase family)
VTLALAGRREDAVAVLASELSASGLVADLADREQATALVDRAEAAIGPVDIVVHNAAVDACARFDQVTAEEIDAVVAVNLVAPLEITRAAIPRMLDRGHGHVVFVSSLSGYGGTAFEAPYAATKGALNALCRSLRAEYAGSPIRFSVVAPGSVAQRGMFARAQAHGIRVPPAMRLTTPEAVARGVIKAIQTDAPEVLVYPGPIRPLLAFGALAPRLSERLNARLGLATLFKPAADARGRA